MPELPEVEVIKNELKKKIVDLVFKDVEVKEKKLFLWNGFSKKDLVDERIEDIKRRAKIVIFNLSGGKSLLFHLKLTGQLIFEDKGKRIAGGHPIPPLNQPVPNKTTHIIFSFTNGGKLFFNDLRKFGWVKLLKTDDISTLKTMTELGPEPLGKTFTHKDFEERLKRHPNLRIKPLLMDQKFIAGIGNIYSDEALWLSKIHPLRQTRTLTKNDIKRLFEAIKVVLESAIKLGGSSKQAFVRTGGEAGLALSYANAYHRTGQPCKRCKKIIKKLKIVGRSAHFCPNCQRLSS